MINNARARISVERAGFFTRSQKKNRKAQLALEYALIIVCLVAALLAMTKYIRRGIQGKLRVDVEPLGKQFDPANTTGFYQTTSATSSAKRGK